MITTYNSVYPTFLYNLKYVNLASNFSSNVDSVDLGTISLISASFTIEKKYSKAETMIYYKVDVAHYCSKEPST